MARRALWLCLLPVLLLPVLLLAISALLPPIAQPPEYHQFAEQRRYFGVSHCLDTLSNLPFIAAALIGERASLAWGRRPLPDPGGAPP